MDSSGYDARAEMADHSTQQISRNASTDMQNTTEIGTHSRQQLISPAIQQKKELRKMFILFWFVFVLFDLVSTSQCILVTRIPQTNSFVRYGREDLMSTTH